MGQKRLVATPLQRAIERSVKDVYAKASKDRVTCCCEKCGRPMVVRSNGSHRHARCKSKEI
jgi:hypothetical protein